MLPLLVLAPLLLGAPVAPTWTVLPSGGGHIALAHGLLSGPHTGDLREAARSFVLLHRAELGLPITSTLGPAQTFSTRFGGSVHFAQLVDGLEVHGGKVIVTFDLKGRVVRLASSLRPYTQAKLAWNLSGSQALRSGADQVEGAALRPDSAPHGGYQPKLFPVGDELHAGYLVWVPTWKTSENWHLAIDATDGAVLWSEDRVHHGFEANVYASSPGGLSAGIGVTPLTSVSLGHFPSGVDGGKLNGEQIRAFNCCPTAGCALDAGAPSRRATGTFQTYGGTISYDLAICDRVQRATNDPAFNPDANYLYPPVDPPIGASPSAQSAADFDEFAEVHAYFHVNKVYDYLRLLSGGPLATDAGFAPFILRDQKLGKVAAVQVNASEPVFPQSPNAQGIYVSNTLQRVDNAMFIARENMAAVSVPEFAFDTDALVLYQGNRADFAYDAPVVWHEFGHGAIYSTANWNRGVVIDSRSANDEASALHEGVADVIAFMVGQESAIGQYIGPRSGATGSLALRNAANTEKCPDVLWGESHQDSQHFAGAIWEARSTLFQGTDQGRTFDAAFYAALVSFPPDVGFEKAAAIISSSIGLAFPGLTLAQAQMSLIFDARGVSNCSKVLDVTNLPGPRTAYIIPGSSYAGLVAGQPVPGPYQLKFRVPKGARSVTVSAPYYSGGSTTARLELLAKSGQPITFTRASGSLSNDADRRVVPAAGGGQMSGTALIDVPCGGELYFTIANTSTRDRTLQNLAFSYLEAASCPVPDAGSGADAGVSADAGSEPADAGTTPAPKSLEAIPDPLGAAARTGCGCTAPSPGLGWLALLAVPWLRRRGRRER